jgi:hypothetical protein
MSDDNKRNPPEKYLDDNGYDTRAEDDRELTEREIAIIKRNSPQGIYCWLLMFADPNGIVNVLHDMFIHKKTAAAALRWSATDNKSQLGKLPADVLGDVLKALEWRKRSSAKHICCGCFVCRSLN